MSALDEDRMRLSGLHFAQDSMRKHERETLHLAEAMLRRIDAVLALCENSTEHAGFYEDRAVFVEDVERALGVRPPQTGG